MGNVSSEVEVVNYSDSFFYPKKVEGLESLVIFPDGDFKRRGVPNSVWVFDENGHKYQEWILANDAGCGMAVFALKKVDPKKFADKIAEYLNGKNVLGRGNHFIDICSGIKSVNADYSEHSIMVVHSDGKSIDNSIPSSVEEAKGKVKGAQEFRKELGRDLAKLAGAYYELVTDLPHNSAEVEDDKVVYRKGSIKVAPKKVHILPSHLGATILWYTVDEDNMPPYSSMPHGTGRKGPLSQVKASMEEAEELRKTVYIPDLVKTPSLKGEHPLCYNGPEKVLDKLGMHIASLGETKILAYVGKI
jgi:hypothetical protein